MAQGSPNEKERVARERELEALQAQLSLLREQFKDHQTRRDALEAVLRDNAQRINVVARGRYDSERQLSEHLPRFRDLEARLQRADRQLEQEREFLAETLVASYKAGLDDRLRLLLDQRHLAEAGRLTGYFQLMAAERQRRITRIKDLASGVSELRQSVLEEIVRLQQLTEIQVETQAELERALASRILILNELDASLAQDRAQMQALEANATALRALLKKLRQEAKRAAQPAELSIDRLVISDRRGQLDWPLSQRQVLSGFQDRNGGSSLHADGIVLAAQTGDEVRAVHAGRVAYADWLRGFGMLLVIEHEDEMMTLYGHNQSLLVEVGEWVEAGDLVALAGSLGKGQSDGVYFALRRQGKPLDPMQWLTPSRG